jgi:AAA15 family ATPase/GTPase
MSGHAPPTVDTMLLNFQASNVRSFYDTAELSLEATVMAERDVPRSVPWREETKHPLRVLPAAGIYGANASGKTNLLRAMDDMRRIVLTSFKNTSRSTRLPRKPFLLDPAAASQPSDFSIDLVLNGIRHEYAFSVDDNSVLSESAHRYTRGKAATIFRREGDAVDIIDGNRPKGRAATEILRNNSLFLSAAAAGENPDLTPLYEWFENNLLLAEGSTRPRRWTFTTHLLAHEESRGQVMDLLHAADLGITGARVREMDPRLKERVKRALAALNDEDDSFSLELAEEALMSVHLSHQGSHGSVEFDVEDESLGTMVWLGMIGPVIEALSQGTVLLADELESSLHPTLVARIVRMFQDRKQNPNGAQLIFTSHEAGLLGNSVGERIIGRDQVWFTEKLNDGRSRLYPLYDLGPRKDEALSRRYLDGRYGATPLISDAEFAAAAAAISSGGKS